MRVGQKSIKTCFCAQINCPAAIFDARKILRVGVAENPSAQCDETMIMSFLETIFLQHFRIAKSGVYKLPGCTFQLFNFSTLRPAQGKLSNYFYTIVIEDFFLVRRSRQFGCQILAREMQILVQLIFPFRATGHIIYLARP